MSYEFLMWLWFSIFGLIGFVAVFDRISALTKRMGFRKRQIGAAQAELPVVIFTGIMLILLRLINQHLVGLDYWVTINFQIIMAIYACSLCEKLVSIALVQLFMLGVLSATGVNPLVMLLPLAISGGIMYLKKPFRRQFVRHSWLLLVWPCVLGLTFWLGVKQFWLITWSSVGLMLLSFYASLICLVTYTLSLQKNQQVQSKLAHAAEYDGLTNVKNWATFQNELTQHYQANEPLAILTLDIDHFKQINDTYGHLAGNQVLVTFAGKLRQVLYQVNPAFELYRTGGEEFTVILTHTDCDQAHYVAALCQKEIRQLKVVYNDTTIHLTASFGLTQRQDHDHSANDIFQRADQSLYLSKQRGRDHITVDGKTLNA